MRRIKVLAVAGVGIGLLLIYWMSCAATVEARRRVSGTFAVDRSPLTLKLLPEGRFIEEASFSLIDQPAGYWTTHNDDLTLIWDNPSPRDWSGVFDDPSILWADRRYREEYRFQVAADGTLQIMADYGVLATRVKSP